LTDEFANRFENNISKFQLQADRITYSNDWLRTAY